MASFLISLAGIGCLCLSMHRHARQVTIPPRAAQPLRVIGWIMIAASLGVSMLVGNWRFAIIEWIGQSGLAAAIIVAILVYRPRTLPATIGVAALGALTTGILM